MKESDVLIYSKSFNKNENKDFISDNYYLRKWVPNRWDLIPQGKSKKYIVFSLFHIFGLFSNSNYSQIMLIEKTSGDILGSLLIVPKFYKWLFMNKCDVQFTYVVINYRHRGKGLGKILLKAALSVLKDDVNQVWYVTTLDNIASQKLAISSGFTLFKKGERISFKRIK